MTTVLQHGEDTPGVATQPPSDAVVLSDGTYLLKILIPTETPGGTFDAIWLQRYAADGTELGSLVGLDAYEQFDTLRIIPLSEGYVVADRVRYQGNPTGEYFSDSFQVFSADGNALGTKTLVTHYLASLPEVDELDSGRLLFSWLFGTIGNFVVYEQSGAVVTSQTFRSLVEPKASAVAGGGFVETWIGIDGHSHSQFYDAAGQPQGTGSAIPRGDTLTRGLDGSLLVTWTSYDAATHTHFVVAQAYDATGHSTSEVTRLGTYIDRHDTMVSALSDGGFIVVWTAGDHSDIYARHLDSTGHLVGQPFPVNNLAAGQISIEGVTATADGGFTVKWVGFTDHWDHYSTAFSATTDMSGANLLFGTSGNDSLDGRQGADTMAGGVGNDTYYVDNAGDQVQELAGAGADWVFSLVTYTLPTDVEILTLRGTADIDGLGNALNNRISGNAGANHLYGGAGNDDLRALAGNDTLSGNSGADTMYGGAGNDLYYADDAGDRVFETAAGDGIDTVRASVDFALGANFENLTLVGTTNLRGFGNTLNNTIAGNSGGNILRGLDGNDVINGAAGADSLIGGTGDDIYYVDNAGDKVYETAGEGTDRVYSSVTFAINSQSIEYVTLTGSANINAAGGDAADQVSGNAGANILTGGAGSDTLIGGAGSDTFVFGLASGTDTISDFLSSNNDHIELHAYSLGVVNGGGITITQSGLDTIIDLGGGNVVTVVFAVAADVNSHIIW